MGSTLLGQGLYDIEEASHLLRIGPDRLSRWVRKTRERPALVEPSLGWLLSFQDLISLLVVRELWDRQVPEREIATGIALLRDELGVDRPLARKGLATVGRSFFMLRGAEYEDAGKGGQGAFQAVIEPLLRPIEYDKDGMAAVWRPRDGVSLNPNVQAGAPCIDSTRIPTATVARLVDGGDKPEAIAWELEVPLADVEAALEYEAELDQAA